MVHYGTIPRYTVVGVPSYVIISWYGTVVYRGTIVLYRTMICYGKRAYLAYQCTVAYHGTCRCFDPPPEVRLVRSVRGEALSQVFQSPPGVGFG